MPTQHNNSVNQGVLVTALFRLTANAFSSIKKDKQQLYFHNQQVVSVGALISSLALCYSG
jgi:hypothetical protein